MENSEGPSFFFTLWFPIPCIQAKGGKQHILATGLRYTSFRPRQKGPLTGALHFIGPALFLLWGRPSGMRSPGQGAVPTQSPHTPRPFCRCPGPWNSLPTFRVCPGVLPRSVECATTIGAYTPGSQSDQRADHLQRRLYKCVESQSQWLEREEARTWATAGGGLPCTTEIQTL